MLWFAGKECLVMLMTVCDVMVCWKGVFGKEASLEIWEIIPVCNVVYLEREECVEIQTTGNISYSTEVSVSSILIYTSDFWLYFINWIIDDFCWVLLCICPVYMGSTPFVCTILGNETRVRLKKLDWVIQRFYNLQVIVIYFTWLHAHEI